MASGLVALKGIFGPYRQTLSHRVVHALFFVFEAPADATALTPNPKLDTPLTATWMPVEDVEKKLALPKVVAQFWREKVLSCRQNEIIHL